MEENNKEVVKKSTNIFNIEEALFRLFATIEDNDGEITDEQYAELIIKEDELKDKLDGYRKMVAYLEGNVAMAETEMKRLKAFADVRKNRIEKLKNIMLDAVIHFGKKDPKKDIYSIDLPTCRLSTRTNVSAVVDDNRVTAFMTEFERYVRELSDNGILADSQQVDLVGVLASMNANIAAEQGDKFEPYTLADLTNLKLQFVTTLEASDLLKTNTDVINTYSKNRAISKMDNVTTKTEWKKRIELSEEDESYSAPTVAHKAITKSLSIK